MPRNRVAPASRRANAARKAPSAAERAMWDILRGSRLGFRFRREHPIGPYRLDFYCHEALLCVEMDGEQHDHARDAKRDMRLSEHGILTYRIPNRSFFMIDREPFRDDVREILRLCEERSGRLAHEGRESGNPSPPAPSPPEGRGGSDPTQGRGGSDPTHGRGGSDPTQGRGASRLTLHASRHNRP
ncbi:MAG: DUF559 domain-containing protein [Chthonomonadaceae bacterium]|nr:DUF559 domain-containing protein [Chthonomonadaceae bacterium]